LGLAHGQNQHFGVRYEPRWGPIISSYTGHATDPSVRRQGSSGGVLSALLIHLLNSRQVDAVLHTGADPDEPLRNRSLVSTTSAEVLAGAGSRYAPASPVADLPAALAKHGRVAFVGKPCDAAAVRMLIAQQPALAERVPYVLSFMCAGTPSHQGTLAVLQRMGLAEEAVTEFRYRGDGWPGLTRAVTSEGRAETLDYNTSWGLILNRHLQTRCKLCADGVGEFADVVCADAWYSKDGYPDFTEREGRSVVLVRTPLGRALVDQARADGAIALEGFHIRELRAIQPYQYRRKSGMLARLAAVRLFGGCVPRYRRMSLLSLALRLAPWKTLREFVGTARRQITGRL
jgi:coenzyme F420 hydrogenase subunit beta